jgi:hypothetical protein
MFALAMDLESRMRSMLSLTIESMLRSARDSVQRPDATMDIATAIKIAKAALKRVPTLNRIKKFFTFTPFMGEELAPGRQRQRASDRPHPAQP